MHVACKRKQAESCFLSALYRLSDLYGGIIIKLHMKQSQLSPGRKCGEGWGGGRTYKLYITLLFVFLGFSR